MRVLGFDHLVIVSADVERSLGFYCGVLGLVPVRVDEWRRGEVLFPSVRVTDTTIIDLLAGTRTGTNIDHLCFVIDTDELDAIAADPAISVAAGPTDGLFGAQGLARSLYVHDPDGNLIELRCYRS